MSQNKYYVYIYLREDGTPYYVGKGKGKRAYSKNHRVNVPENKDKIVFANIHLSEENALKRETELILQYGRKDIKTGILENRTSGGAAGTGRNPVLTETQVQELRQNRKKFILIKDLMKHYGLSKASIYRALNDGKVSVKSKNHQAERLAFARKNGVKFGRKKAFTETQAQELRQKHREGMPIKDLMNQYGMARSTIYRALASKY
jgi:predicted DNA-binding transcriptional regulator AlpA